MVLKGKYECSNCGGKLKYYDKVKRIVRTKGRNIFYISISRYCCSNCRKVHRSVPNDIMPYKQYEAEIINGVLEGLITSDTFGFENYPSEATMARWLLQFGKKSGSV